MSFARRRPNPSIFATLIATLSFGAIALEACGGDGDCNSPGGSCFEGDNDGSSDGLVDGSVNGDAVTIVDDDGGVSTGDDGGLGSCDAGCAKGARCKYETCVPDLGSCTTDDDCPGDSYCDTDKTCVPYGVPATKTNDPTCKKPIVPGNVVPTVQCEWPSLAADAGALFAPSYLNVYTTPVVADLNLDLDPGKLQPSIVLTTWFDAPRASDTSKKERIGILRVFDGRTCEEQMHIGAEADPENDSDPNRPGYGTQWAIGDLDGDVGTPAGHPEIVGLHRTAGQIGTNPKLQAIAFSIDTSGAKPKLVRKWVGHTCFADGGTADVLFPIAANTANFGPGIWDLDDDGKPEVVVDQFVFDGNGCLLNAATAADQKYLDHGLLSAVADVDADGKPDLVRGDGVYGWNALLKKWELKSYFNQATLLAALPGAKQPHGHVAIADLGAYSTLPGKLATDKIPEIIVTSAETVDYAPSSSGTIRVQTLTGEVVFGPIPLFHVKDAYGGHGGAPTAADFDGDGQIEFAAAANEFYVVYDPDCLGTGPDAGVSQRPGGKCVRPSYMLPYGAGAPLGSDAGYAWNPGANPLNGILWAQPSQDRSSSETGSSVFDFNGDGQAEAVYRDECYLRVYKGATGEVIFSAPASSGTGQEEPVICDVDGDFATEIIVARATNNPACPATDPLFPASGTFFKRGGFEVLRDSLDRWASSRPVWNQHAYDVTNVNENASVPKSSARLRNWEQSGLNNYRQNTQGSLSSLSLADLTVQMDKIAQLCSGASGTIPLSARVCNRGTNPVQDGATISFFATPRSDAGGVDAASGSLVCTLTTPGVLLPSACVTLSCTGNVPANQDIYVVADPEHKIADCHPNNNAGASARALCTVIPN